LLELGKDVLRSIDRVGRALLDHDHPDRRLSVQASIYPLFLTAVAYGRHLAEGHERAIIGTDRNRAHLLNVAEIAQASNRIFGLPLTSDSSRKVEILFHDSLAHIAQREMISLKH